jgi:hypothetical protein
MPRIRTIKPEFWSDEKLAPLEPIDRLAFLGLISMADDFGRVHGNVKVIDAFVFPECSRTVRESIAKLSRMGRIRCGKSSSGKQIIQIQNWQKHQRVDKPQTATALPEIAIFDDENHENTEENEVRESFANDSGMNREPLATLSGIRDQGSGTDDQGSSLSAQGSGRDEYTETFEKFWSVYPTARRTKKKEAFRRWRVAIRNADAEMLIRRAIDYAASDQGKSEFAVMPSVWLNSQMWQDAPEAWMRRGSNPTPGSNPVAPGKQLTPMGYGKRTDIPHGARTDLNGRN